MAEQQLAAGGGALNGDAVLHRELEQRMRLHAGEDRLAVRRAITRLAGASGVAETRARLIDLAAVALAWAAALPHHPDDQREAA